MRFRVAVIVALTASGAFGLLGCRDEAKEISNSDYLLGLQHRAWKQARESLHSAQPQLWSLRAVEALLASRTLRRMKKDYSGPNKEQAIAKLEAIRDAFQAEIMPKLVLDNPGQVTLKPGATLEQIRLAFDKLDEQYRDFQAMVPAEQ